MKCRICGADGEHTIFHAKEIVLQLYETFDYFRCSNCGCLQIAEIPDNMQKYYANGYYSFVADPYDSLSSMGKRIDILKDWFGFLWARSINKIVRSDFVMRKWITLPHWNKNSRILDIGCGSGNTLLKRLNRLGFRHLLGVDPYIDSDICLCEDFHILKRSIDSIEGEFDTIVLSHSLEHMPDQQAVFRKLSTLLTPQGELAIIIPIYSDFFMKRYNDLWYAWDAPRHFYLHSHESFANLVSSFGFKVVNKVYYSHPVCLVESERRLAERSGDELLLKQFNEKTPQQWAKELNIINRANLSDCCNFLLKRV